MFAVLKTGGKQYKVAPDDIITVEKLPGEAGSAVQLPEVLMVGDEKGVTVGAPFVANTVVGAEIVEHTRGDKIIVFKKNRRHRYRRKNGHRQDLTVLRITDVGGTSGKKAAEAKKPAAKEVTAKPAAEKKATPAKAATEKKAAPKKTAAEKKAAPKAKETK